MRWGSYARARDAEEGTPGATGSVSGRSTAGWGSRRMTPDSPMMADQPDPPRQWLSALVRGLEGARVCGAHNVLVRGIAHHSLAVKPGDLFFCLRGSRHDGHAHAAEAVERGAAALAVERPLAGLPAAVPQVLVRAARPALGVVAARLYGNPSERLSIVGITGTAGKTTTAALVDSILRVAGRKTGMIGTIVNRVGSEATPAELTTPEAPELQRLLWQCLRAGVTDVVMEVSSHALAQGRVAGCEFDVAVVTNLHSDHLDYHGSWEAYRAAKIQLFATLGRGPAKRACGIGVVNGDDPHAALFRRAASCPVLTFAMRGDGHVVGRCESTQVRRTVLAVMTGRRAGRVTLQLSGAYNAANALAAVAVAESLAIAPEAIEAGLEQLAGVPGRFEVVANRLGLLIVIDFAHTTAAYQALLETARQLARRRVITVFGCAGDRDRTKRAEIGRIVAELSDLAIVTTDNPASEDPAEIASEITGGMRAIDPTGHAHRVILDRFTAVQTALALAREGDAVILAGKGHEQFQLVEGCRVRYSDRWAVEEYLTRGGRE